MLGNQTPGMTSHKQQGYHKHREARVSDAILGTPDTRDPLGRPVPFTPGFENQPGLTMETLKISELNSGRAREL